MPEVKEAAGLPPPDIRAKNPFLKTLSVFKHTPDQEVINEALWGHPDGFEALAEDKQQATTQKMYAELQQLQQAAAAQGSR